METLLRRLSSALGGTGATTNALDALERARRDDLLVEALARRVAPARREGAVLRRAA
jgi:hypothetical protein